MAKREEISSKQVAPLASSGHIRSLLDAVDRLGHLQVMKEGIQLPTIVVVGDQSSGKSNVLESLAGISLPPRQGIYTHLPLVMRLHDEAFAATSTPSLQLEYRDKVVATTEADITDAINAATKDIAGDGQCISGEPLTLVVKKKGIPNLTLVDLPELPAYEDCRSSNCRQRRQPVREEGVGRKFINKFPLLITIVRNFFNISVNFWSTSTCTCRLPSTAALRGSAVVNIHDQIFKIIMEYITPSENIILNVLSATVDISTCESIRMSQSVDKTGQRTLTVVTKSDRAPKELLEKVTVDDVDIGLGYVFVRNRVGGETYEEARVEEEKLFASHPLLTKVDKSIIGIPMLAQKLVQIQATNIARCLPEIIRKINDKLIRSVADLNDMPQNLTNLGEAMRAFMRIIGMAKESLRKVLIRGDYDEFPDEQDMHGAARLADMLNSYAGELPATCPDGGFMFLMEEVMELIECKGPGLPKFLPRTAFLAILRRKVQMVAHTPTEFILRVWSYMEDVVVRILVKYSENYPSLQASMRRAARNVMEKMMSRSFDHVKVMIEMEKLADYTSNPDYRSTWASLRQQLDGFMEAVEDNSKPTRVSLKLLGEVDIGHLREYKANAELAFDMRMRLVAYWRSITLRIVDGLALHLFLSVRNLVEDDMEIEILNELVGLNKNCIECMLEESPAEAGRRERLKNSIKLLKESKEVVSKIMNIKI